VQLSIQMTQCDTYDVAMVQLRPDPVLLGQFSPQPVDELDIGSLQLRYMRSQDKSCGAILSLGYNLDRDDRVRLRQFLRGAAEFAGLFLWLQMRIAGENDSD
jgi:hypothetical protein